MKMTDRTITAKSPAEDRTLKLSMTTEGEEGNLSLSVTSQMERFPAVVDPKLSPEVQAQARKTFSQLAKVDGGDKAARDSGLAQLENLDAIAQTAADQHLLRLLDEYLVEISTRDIARELGDKSPSEYLSVCRKEISTALKTGSVAVPSICLH